MKVIKLDKYDINHLLRIILEQDDRGTPKGEFADTKAELINQAKENINNMILSENSGTILSLIIELFNEEENLKGLESIGITLNRFLKGGGKEVDFNRQMTAKIRPYFKAVIEGIEQIASTTLEEEGIYFNDEEQQPETDSRATLKQSAQNVIKNLSGTPSVSRAFSIILLYLTDRDTKADLERYGQLYGKKINKITDNYELQDVFKNKLYKSFNIFMKKLAESLDDDIKKIEPEIEQTTQFKQDQQKIQNIIKKYS